MKPRSDFAEWLSPMVVKELRQGMRSRVFVTSFLLLQGGMIFVALVALAASAHQQDIRAMTTLFWVICGVPLLLMMPISGFGAVANEITANSLELIFLTRLTPRRIIAGKWFAIVAQTALFACAVLPYAVLRYFLGGVNVGRELAVLAGLLLGSALLSGIAVGLSPQSSRAGRAILPIAIVFGVQFLVPFVTYGMAGSSLLRGGRTTTLQTYFGLFVAAVLLLLVCWNSAPRRSPRPQRITARRAD